MLRSSIGFDHNTGLKPWASALRQISRNALASDSARLTIDAHQFNNIRINKMTKNEQWIDDTFDELRSRGASFSESFSDELEERLMNERMKPNAPRRPLAWALLIAMISAGIAGGAYAGGKAIKEWIYGPFHVGMDGLVRNEDGDVVGKSHQNEDGTTDMSLQLDDDTGVSLNLTSPLSSFSFTVGDFSISPENSSDADASAIPDSSKDK
jgi:hypothetical protein